MQLKKIIPLLILGLVLFGSLVVFTLGAEAQTEAGYEISVSIPGGAQSGEKTDLAGYIRSIYRFVLALTAIAALVSLIIGGIIYITSETISSKENALDFIKNAVWGLGLALAAYLILYTINPDLVSLREPALPSPSGGGPSGGGSTNNRGTTQGLTEEGARAQLTQAHIGIKPECEAGQTTNCVRLAGIKQATLDEIIKLKQECPDCAIFVTGGTEPGHESTAHENGYKVDLRLDDTLNNYIMGPNGQGDNGFTYAGERTGPYGGPRYQRGNATYVKETNDPHWDVLVSS